jgi:hypothetical protein
MLSRLFEGVVRALKIIKLQNIWKDRERYMRTDAKRGLLKGIGGNEDKTADYRAETLQRCSVKRKRKAHLLS